MIESRDFIVFSDDWMRHPSSCQHIFKRIARKNRVLWVNTIGMRLPRLTWQDLRRSIEKLVSWGKPDKDGCDGVIVYSPIMTPFSHIRFFRRLNDILLIKGIKKQLKKHKLQNFTVVTTVPNVSGLVGRLGEKNSVYYCVDDFSKWPGMLKKALAEMEQELLDKVDLVLTVSEELFRLKKSTRCPTYMLTHGVDAEHFGRCALEETEIHEDIRRIQGEKIGYFGLFDERIDLGLLEHVSVTHPDWAITILGQVAVDAGSLKNFKNVHFLGKVDYAELPNYAKGFDVCVLPYVVNDATLTLSPLKFKEYLATGKPIVTTRLPEIEKYAELVNIADTKEGFVAAIDSCLNDGNKVMSQRRQNAVANEDWAVKAEEFLRYLSNIPAKKINVMHLRIVTGSGGGPEKTILLSTQRTDKERFNVVSVYLKNKDDDNSTIKNKAADMGVVLHEVLEQGKLDWQAFKEIRRLIEEYDIDILDCHDYKTDILGFILSKLRPVKLITTIHGWSGKSLKEQSYYLLDKVVIRHFDRVISVYKGMGAYLSRIGIPKGRLTSIYNAIDADDFKRDPDIANIRAELNLEDEDIIIGNVCRLNKEKNLETFLLAAEKITAELKNVKFILVGDGPEKDSLKTYAKKLNIEDKVIFLGARKDIKNIYNGLDLFMLTSFKEGLPNVVLEALAMEVPVVATKVDGVPELIEDGINGLLFSPKDVEGIASGAIRILKDRQFAENFRREGRKTVCERFSFAERTRKMEELYLEVMGQGMR